MIRFYKKESITQSRPPNNTFLTLHRLIGCEWFSIWAHKIHGGQNQFWHDHASKFVSIVIWGKYVEEYETEDGEIKFRKCGFGSISTYLATRKHRVHNDDTCWTLVFRWPTEREIFMYYKGRPIPWRKLLDFDKYSNTD